MAYSRPSNELDLLVTSFLIHFTFNQTVGYQETDEIYQKAVGSCENTTRDSYDKSRSTR